MTRSLVSRLSTRKLAVLGVACAVLAAIAACSYVFWGWVSIFRSPVGYFPGMRPIGWDPAEARASAAEAARWAHASKYLAFGLTGLAFGGASVGAWRSRLTWRSWPWPSLLAFVPALFALAITLLGAAKGDALKVTLGIQIVSLIAAGTDLWRGTPGSPSRPVSWAVLAMGLLAILLRPLIPSG